MFSFLVFHIKASGLKHFPCHNTAGTVVYWNFVYITISSDIVLDGYDTGHSRKTVCQLLKNHYYHFPMTQNFTTTFISGLHTLYYYTAKQKKSQSKITYDQYNKYNIFIFSTNFTYISYTLYCILYISYYRTFAVIITNNPEKNTYQPLYIRLIMCYNHYCDYTQVRKMEVFLKCLSDQQNVSLLPPQHRYCF